MSALVAPAAPTPAAPTPAASAAPGPSSRPAFPPGLGVAVVVVSVSFAAPLFRLADAPALTASFWRLAFAVLLLAPFGLRAIPAWRSYRARDWGITAAAGVALALHFALWVQSLFMTSVAAATVLVTLQCVFVAVGGHLLLGDRLRPAAWLGVLVAVLGGIVIGYGDASPAAQAQPPMAIAGVQVPRAIVGDALAFLAGLGSATYMLIGRRLRQGRGLLEYVLPVYTVAALALLLALPFVHQPLVAGMGGPNFLAFVLLAAVPMLGGHTVSNWVLKHLPAHTIATWILLEPVGAALLAWVLVPEAPTWWTFWGGLLVLAGAFLTIPRKAAATTEGAPLAATEPPG